MDCSLPGSSIHGIFQARVLEWAATSFCKHWKRSLLIPFPKNGNAKECSNHHTIALISHASKMILKILQASLQHYVNWELPDVQTEFRIGRGTRGQTANICCITEKAREFQKNVYFGFIDFLKAFDCVNHSKRWKILKDGSIRPHLTCLLRNLYMGQDATVRTGHELLTSSKRRKQYNKAVYCHLAYLIYMQSTSCEMLDWMNHKQDSRLMGEISTTSDMQMIPL